MNTRNIMLCIVQLSLIYNASHHGWDVQCIDNNKFEISKICDNPENIDVENVLKNMMPLCWYKQRSNRINDEYIFIL